MIAAHDVPNLFYAFGLQVGVLAFAGGVGYGIYRLLRGFAK
ncbi:MAG: hypothetical protein NVSMB29_11950 [Candidatus Dormibacteria bacterium]